MGARQTRLRREYAAWYPTISVGTWIPASTVARAVMRQLLERESPKALCPRWEPGPRIALQVSGRIGGPRSGGPEPA